MKNEQITTKDLKLDKSNIEEKLKTPAPHENLPQIKIKSTTQINECKSSVPSPNEKNRDSSEQSFSYKNSMTKIVSTTHSK
jgi:hypothetical protein